MPVLALDLGGTKLAAAIFTGHGKILHRSLIALEGRGGRVLGKVIQRKIQTLLTFAQENGIHITAIGVSVPGISQARAGRVWAPNIPGWKNYPLRREIQSALRGHRRAARSHDPLAVHIDSDRACSILGEAWRGSARGCRNAIFLAVGTGIGAGILVDGHILRGAHDVAGAIGWMALNRPFRPEYTKCGCFEHHASGAGLAKVARELRATQRFHAPTPLGSQSIFAAYDGGDPLAKAVVTHAIEFWGMAVANLTSLFNPEKIIFGGGVFGPATKFLDAIYAESKKWAQPVSIKQITLEPSELGSDAALYGAAHLALNGPK